MCENFDSIVFILLLFTVSVTGSEPGRPVFDFENFLSKLSKPPEITDMLIVSQTYSRFTTVSIKSQVENDAIEPKETTFSIQLPDEAFITEFKMENDNRILYGVIKRKKEAQAAYDKAREQGQSAGHVRQTSPPNRHMKIFSIDMNVAAKSSSIFELKYQEQLKRNQDKYTHKIHFEVDQLVPNITLISAYEEEEGIDTFQYSVPGSKEYLSSSSSSVQLTASPTKRTVIFKPVLLNPNKKIRGDFTVSYSIPHDVKGGRLVLTGDTFVHYFAPNDNEITPISKNIIFVIDVSGSMSGNKIIKTREAMHHILNRLKSNEIFNIIIFNGKVSLWQKKAQRATADYVAAARGFVEERVQAGGSTNINSALLEALDNLIRHVNEDPRRASMIVFLTDGEPTAGVVNENEILNNIKKRNEGHVSIYCLGFGFSLNFNFLKKIAYQNGGTAHRIWDAEDSSTQLMTFYEDIRIISLKNVRFQYPENEVRIADVTDTEFPICFAGTELVVVGKVKPNSNELTARVTAVGGNMDASYSVATARTDITQDQIMYFDRIWAFKKIKQYLNMAIKTDSKEKTKFYEEKALNLSLSYKFVTPLTSMIVTESVHKGELSTNNINELFRAKSGIFARDMSSIKRSSQLSPYDNFAGRGSVRIPSLLLIGIVIICNIFM